MSDNENAPEVSRVPPSVRGRSEPLAIIGLGAMFPGAASVDEFWCNVRDGVDSISEVPETHWSPEDYFDEDPSRADHTYGRRGGFLDTHDFDPREFGISPSDLASTDTTQLLGMVVAKAALSDAGYGDGTRTFDRRRTSVILGVTGALELVIPLGARLGHPRWRRALEEAGVDAQTRDKVLDSIAESYVPWTESSFPGLLGNVAAGRIASRLDLHGTNCVVDAACASSLSALHLAALELETKRADLVLAGGLDTFNDIFMYMCFSKTPALSPSGDARPFDREGDGTILGEGLGVVAVKRLADARRDGDRVYAVVRGLGTGSDGRGVAVYEPSAVGQARALRDAYEQADVEPSTVQLVEAHGTGTRVGDATEVRALTEVYRESAPEREPWCAIGSVKSNVGHTKAAAGAAGLIKAVLALHHRVLPPTLKVSEPNGALDGTPFYANVSARPWARDPEHPRRAAVSAFGFGGTNFHCVLEEDVEESAIASDGVRSTSWSGSTQVLALSAGSRAELAERLRSLGSAVSQSDWRAVRAQAANSRSAFDPSAAARLCLVLQRSTHPHGSSDLLADAERRIAEDRTGSVTTSDLFFSELAPVREVAALFPGQGSQKVGMLRELLLAFPEANSELLEADAEFQRLSQRSLIDLVYPIPAFDDEAIRAQSLALRATEVAQPALAAVSLAAWRLLERFELPFRVAIGHSFGELVALAASGRFEARDLYRLAHRRGELMAQGSGDRGTMLAVTASAEVVKRALRDGSVVCRIANYNSTDQVVLSGGTEAIETAREVLHSQGILTHRLDVAAAFHSSFVGDAVSPFAEEVERTAWKEGSLDVLANSTGESYPEHPGAQRLLLAQQLAEPVLFRQSVETAIRRGTRLFVEVGPGQTLSKLVHRIDAGTRTADESSVESAGSVRAIPLERGVGELGLARMLAELASAGVPFRLEQWDPMGDTQEVTRRFRVPISGANLRSGPGGPRLGDAPRGAREQKTDRAQETAAERLRRDAERTTSMHPVSGSVPAGVRQQSALGEDDPGIDSTDSSSQQTSAAPVVPDSPPAAEAVSIDEVQQHGEAAASRSSDEQSLQVSGTAALERPSDPADAEGGMVSAEWWSRGMDALLSIQQQTAEAHRRFLDSQNEASERMERLLAASARYSSAPSRSVVLSREEEDRSSQDAARASAAAEAAGELDSEGDTSDQEMAPRREIEIEVTEVESAAPSPRVPASQQREERSVGRVATDGLQQILLEVVSERTGYPVEMLEPDMELDADLGIDSIKRVEILSALQERLPEVELPEPEDLAQLATLASVVEAMVTAAPSAPQDSAEDSPANQEKAPESAPELPIDGAAAQVDPGVAALSAADTESLVRSQTPGGSHSGDAPAVTAILLEVVSERTGYPVEMLELEMELDADLGIDSIKRVEILSALQERLPELDVPEPERLAELATLAAVAAEMQAGPQAATKSNEPPLEDSIVAAEVPAESASSLPRSAVPVNPQAGTQNAGTQNSAKKSSPPPLETAGAPSGESAMSVLLEVVAERTGYPVEMLEPEMELDADLGIDSIKRVEILSVLQETYPDTELPEPDELAALSTLQAVADALDAALVERPAETKAASDRPMDQPDRDSGARSGATLGSGVGTADASDSNWDSLRADARAVSESTHDSRPPVVVEAAHEVEIDGQVTGQVDGQMHGPAASSIPSQTNASAEASTSEIVALLDRYVLAAGEPETEDRGSVLERGSRIWVVGPDEVFATRLTQELAGRGYLAEAIEIHSPRPVPSDLNALILLGPRGVEGAAGDRFVLDSFRWVQRCSSALRASAAARRGALLAGIVRLDGSFGLLGNSALGGVEEAGVAGLIKTARWEWPDVECRIVDWSPALSDDAGEIVNLADELLSRGPLEVGLGPQGRVTPKLVRQAASEPIHDLGSDALLVFTGGARGITAEIAVAVAARWHPRLVILGRTPIGDDEPAELSGVEDPVTIKRYLAQQQPGTLREIEARYQALVARREALANLQRMREAGSIVDYRAVDLRDAAKLQETVLEIVGAWGPVTGVVHGAGVLADKSIEDKAEEDFRRVYDTKVVGLRNLLAALQGHPLSLIVSFSSTTARFGRRGQCDYAAANEVLNKIAQREARERPGCRALALGWGPWDGGMVSDSLKQVFASEGVELILSQDGAESFLAEIAGASTGAEVVLLGRGSVLPEAVDTNTSPPPAVLGSEEKGSRSVCLERTLSLQDHEFLAAHVLDGYPVLPAAVMMDWMAHAALHGQPGRQLHSLNDFRILKGVRLREPTCGIRLLAGEVEAVPGGVVVPVEIRSAEQDHVLHASGRVMVVDELSAVQGSPEPVEGSAYPHSPAQFYEESLFHGPALQGIERVEICGPRGILGRCRHAPPPAEWMRDPVRGRWLIDPLLVDSAFQLMILWSLSVRQAPSLPAYLESYEQFAAAPRGGLVDVQCQVVDEGPNRARADIHFFAGDQLLARIRGYECVIDASLARPFRRNRIDDRSSGGR